jgi:HD superfamily phosphohydrolase
MNPIFITGEKTFIKDIIHDSIELSPIARTIIDTPIFQRLRNLHQLGVCYLIFPNANNNRFEHSIGTYHLAGLLLERLIKNSKNKEINKCLIEIDFIKKYLLKHFELNGSEENLTFLENINMILLDDYLIELIKIAGLVHDIGHGPFSHLFDEWLGSIPEVSDSKLAEHESRSIILLKKIIFENKIKFKDDEYMLKDFIDEDAFEFISELINPTESTPKNFIFQIISNYLNGLDVDKLDYLYRDSFYLGSGNPYDLSRVISHVQVIDKNICFPEKISYDIYKVFRSRYDLHKQYYTHKTTVSIEYMIRDILENLDPILQISKNIQEENISKFIDLDDHTILNTAKILKNFEPTYLIWKKQIDLVENIINRIYNRDLYKCIYGETFYTDENVSQEELFKKLIDKFNSSEDTNFKFELDDKEYIVTVKLKIGLLGGNKSHPLDSVYFYNNQNKSILLDKTKISHIMSSLHQEIIYYLIYKK